MLQIAGGADVAIVHVFNTRSAALFDDLSREIDFVMWRTNTWTQLHDQVGRVRPKLFRHLSDRVYRDLQLSSFLSRMREADASLHRINKVNCATIRHINPEKNVGLICNQGIAVLETSIRGDRRIDNCDPFAVNLLRGQERRLVEP